MKKNNKTEMKMTVTHGLRELLTVAYWWEYGLMKDAPAWVLRHPMWPPNNDQFDKATAHTAAPGRERLWQAIAVEFGLELR